MNAFEQMNFYGKEGIPFFFMLDFDLKQPVVISVKDVDNRILYYDLEGFKNIPDVNIVRKKTHFKIKEAVSYEKYSKTFQYCQQQLRLGNSYLLNLTFPTEIETNLSLQEIFLLSSAKYKLWYQDIFVCFSPETFIKISGGKIFSFPMKGTIDASVPDAENMILHNEKETAEHNTIVDLMRNDLSMVAKNVRVDSFRYIDRVNTNNKNLLQVSSRLSGTLPQDFASHIGDILYKLLPAGSISGAPKKRTLEIIHQAEQYQRGYYTGVFGYFDGNDLNSAVLIRFIEKINGKLYYKSGGGITTGSRNADEYEELLNKIYLSL